MSSIKISWIFGFFNCFILLTVSGDSRPGVRTLLTTRGLNLVRKLVIPVITKKLNNLEISPISGNVDFFVGNVNYKFKNIRLSDVKIPESHLSMLNSTGILVKGTRITIELDELWSYELTSWPFISDKGSATVSAKDISLDVIVGISKGSKDEPSITANKCSLNIGNLDVEFRGGASFLYNFFMTFIKDQLKNQIEVVICRNAIKEVNKEIKTTLRTIPDKVRMANDTVESNIELVCPPRVLPNCGLELDFKGEFHNVQHPTTPPYKPEELPQIRNGHSKMLFMWITAYTINTVFFSVYQNGPQHYMFTSEDLPDNIPVKLNTNAFMLVVPQLYQKYPDKEMAIGYRDSAPVKISLKPDDGSATLFGEMTFYVLLDDDRLMNCFVLSVIEVAKIDDVLIFEKENYSYIGLELSSSRTDVTLNETHIGNFDITLLEVTVDILSQFIVSSYISPKMEEGLKLPLPKEFEVYNGDSVIGKDYILISTDLKINRE